MKSYDKSISAYFNFSVEPYMLPLPGYAVKRAEVFHPNIDQCLY